MENPHRLIPGPLGTTKYTADESFGQTDGTPTVVNKRKYVPSNSSTSSSSASSTPPSPASGVNHQGSVPGERLMLRLPRRTQVAKRPRLHLTPPEGDVTVSSVQSRQTLAPPPVFRRRPPTPFNRAPGAAGDQAEGSGYVEGNGNDEAEVGGSSTDASLDLSSEDSLNLPLPRRRLRLRSDSEE